jgi:hypothetical protein
VLKAAFAEGRLDQDEYNDRVGLVHESRTYAELAALTADLPVGPLGTLFPGGQFPGAQFPGGQFPGAQFPGGQPPAIPAGPGAPAVPADSAQAASDGARPVSQLAIASLFFGLATLLFPVLPITLFPAIILGVAALARISTAGQRGVGMAAAGIGLALLGTFGPFFGFFFYR